MHTIWERKISNHHTHWKHSYWKIGTRQMCMKWLLIIRHVNSVKQCQTVSTVSTVIARCYLHLRWYFSMYKGINAFYWSSIINCQMLPSVLCWPSTQLPHLVMHSWANCIYFCLTLTTSGLAGAATQALPRGGCPTGEQSIARDSQKNNRNYCRKRDSSGDSGKGYSKAATPDGTLDTSFGYER